jgi:hypothetical protein
MSFDMTTNYFQTFITASSDSKAEVGTVPAKVGGIASLQYTLLIEQPYTFTSDDLLFEVHVQRNGITDADRDVERAAFFSKAQACLRASPLVKQYGWGLHHDQDGKVAAVALETGAYRALCQRPDIKSVPGIRSRRA